MPIFCATPDDDHFPGTRGAEDIVSYANAAAFVTIDLRRPGPQPTGGSGMDNLVWIDSLIGSDFNDVLIGSGDSGSLSGGLGDDSIIVHLVAPGSRISLDGGADTDTLTVDSTGLGSQARFAGGLGVGFFFDNFYGVRLDVAGFERLVFMGSAAESFYGPLTGGAGDDVLSGLDQDDSFAGGEGNDFIRGRAGNDTVHGDGGHDTITGGDGIDILYGDDGNDQLHGDAGNDFLYGGLGVDFLYGGTGADRMEGGEGGDHYYIDNALDVIIEGGAIGRDVVHTSINYTMAEDIEEVVIDDNAEVTVHGNANDNKITGASVGRGNEYIYGEGGNDILRGGMKGGHTQLIGGEGDDILIANENAAIMFGGEGNDVLQGAGYFYGLSGYDKFIITGNSTIQGLDLTIGERIDLSLIDANILTPDVNDAFTYLGAAGPYGFIPFNGKPGELKVTYFADYDWGRAAGVEGDLDGDKIADLYIVVHGYLPSADHHFIL